jgi:hypothetical protein
LKNPKIFLQIAALLSFTVALFQFVITFSPEWSRYFGAPEEILSNIFLLYTAGFIAAIIFVLFGLYAWSGAGNMRPLPALRWGLVVISLIYILRGLLAIPVYLQEKGCIRFSDTIGPVDFESSLVSLAIGVVYLSGVIRNWQSLDSINKKR